MSGVEIDISISPFEILPLRSRKHRRPDEDAGRSGEEILVQRRAGDLSAHGTAFEAFESVFTHAIMIETRLDAFRKVPEMPDAFVNEVSERYIELYENITGEPFVKADTANMEERILKNINEFISK